MFKNRRIELRLVKDTPTPETITTESTINLDAIAAETRKTIKQMVVGAVVVAGAVIVLNTLGAIAINALDPQD